LLTIFVLAIVGHLKNVSPTFAQMPSRITNVEFITVSPTVANTMLAVRAFVFVVIKIIHILSVKQIQSFKAN
jgi:hypothetical protein